jgi:hypothetical protein
MRRIGRVSAATGAVFVIRSLDPGSDCEEGGDGMGWKRESRGKG